MDTAIEAAERGIAAAWQLASGNDGARTPAYANAMTEDPELRARMDDVLRPFVATIATKLREGDWDCIDESNYFDRFPMEMQGWTKDEYAEHLTEHIRENPLSCRKETDALRKLQGEGK
jgi:hypothetical protein